MEAVRQGWVDLVSFVVRRRSPPPTPTPVVVPPIDAPEEMGAGPIFSRRPTSAWPRVKAS